MDNDNQQMIVVNNKQIPDGLFVDMPTPTEKDLRWADNLKTKSLEKLNKTLIDMVFVNKPWHVKTLLDSGADKNKKLMTMLFSSRTTFDRENGLSISSGKGYLDIVKIFLSYGTEIQTYALRRAAKKKRLDICHLLIKHGAHHDQDNSLVLRTARQLNDYKMIEFLEECGQKHDTPPSEDLETKIDIKALPAPEQNNSWEIVDWDCISRTLKLPSDKRLTKLFNFSAQQVSTILEHTNTTGHPIENLPQNFSDIQGDAEIDEAYKELCQKSNSPPPYAGKGITPKIKPTPSKN